MHQPDHLQWSPGLGRSLCQQSIHLVFPRNPHKQSITNYKTRITTYSQVGNKGLCCGTVAYAATCQASIPFQSVGMSIAALLLIQHPANISGKTAKDGPSTWASATHMGDPDGIPSSWIWSGPALSYCSKLGSKTADRRPFPTHSSFALPFK